MSEAVEFSVDGLVPDWGGSQRLSRTIGLRRALDLLLSARWITADAAEGLAAFRARRKPQFP